MSLKLIVNEKLDMTFLKNTLKTEAELKVVNPSANFPFEEDYWLSFYKLDGKKSYSLLLVDGDKTIGHAALQKSLDRDGIIFLCFVLIDKDYRGQGYSSALLMKTERFLRATFNDQEYFLNVAKSNTRAIKLYEKFGFEVSLDKGSTIRMRKGIKG